MSLLIRLHFINTKLCYMRKFRDRIHRYTLSSTRQYMHQHSVRIKKQFSVHYCVICALTYIFLSHRALSRTDLTWSERTPFGI